uniref:Uncharacterized protein n=1 Tax=Picea sitchensis TaxID=3332 RepID=A0A6B9XXQ2_PICSI|nr:hypothetical protein Q903MT_gene6841 [Picea sitchensis]
MPTTTSTRVGTITFIRSGPIFLESTILDIYCLPPLSFFYLSKLSIGFLPPCKRRLNMSGLIS